MESTVATVKSRRSARFSTTAGVRRVLFAVLVLVLMGYFGISAVVADKLSHPTRHAITRNPTDIGLKYENVQFNSTVDNVPLKGWYLDSPGSKVIVMMHGRNGTRDGGDMLTIASLLVKHNYDVLTFDFRAHGESGGERYSLGSWATRDVAGALAYLKGRGVNEVGTLAFSMGAATELLAAPDHPEMKALVSDSAFSDLGALLDKELPRNSGLPGIFNPGILFMVRAQYGIDIPGTKPRDALARLGDRPVLLIHSQEDELIPVSHAYDLQKMGAADHNLQLWIAPGSGHTRAYRNNPDEYMSRLLAFYDKYLR